MKSAFTICTANYLPFAKTLADSLTLHNPDYTFFIALADTYDTYDVLFFAPHTIVPVAKMGFGFLNDMNERYTVFELTCALKPYVAAYLFEVNPDCEWLFYFDADIMAYGSLAAAETALQNAAIVITPHLLLALPYEKIIHIERDILRAGIYNAGFFGLRRSRTVFSFLSWWKERLFHLSFDKVRDGLFVDQLWLNLVPLYFPDTAILSDPGYNLAYWNFSERRLEQRNGSYWVNDTYPLVFFHFSGYNILEPEKISKHMKEPDVDRWPQYRPLFLEFASLVLQNNRNQLLRLSPTMGNTAFPRQNGKQHAIFQILKKFFGK